MKILLGFAAIFALATAGLSPDTSGGWSQFRGPNGSGIAENEKPPVELGPEKNVKWKTPVPSGLSSPIVAGDLLVLTAFDDGKLVTIAYRRDDGTEAWRAEASTEQIEGYYKSEGSPASSTPATDGKRIISYFGSCGLLCYDLSGNELWKLQMPTAVTAGNFGSGVSPIIADEMVILVRDELAGSKIIAVDLNTGVPKWETRRESVASYCTPVVLESTTGKQIVTAGNVRLISYDLASGKEQWSVTGMPSAICSSPTAVNGTLFFAGWSPGAAGDAEGQMPGFDVLLQQDADKDGTLSREESALGDFFDINDTNKDGKIVREEWDALVQAMASGVNSAFAVKSDGKGDITESHVLWKKTRGLPQIATAIVYAGQYVMVKDGGIITAYDAHTGEDVYVQKRVAAVGRYWASPVAANGNIYFVSLEDGAVTVIKGGAQQAEVVAENPKLGERVAATPAIAVDTLYIRTDQHLYAFAEED